MANTEESLEIGDVVAFIKPGSAPHNALVVSVEDNRKVTLMWIAYAFGNAWPTVEIHVPYAKADAEYYCFSH
jgi:hypothetical protein